MAAGLGLNIFVGGPDERNDERLDGVEELFEVVRCWTEEDGGGGAGGQRRLGDALHKRLTLSTSSARFGTGVVVVAGNTDFAFTPLAPLIPFWTIVSFEGIRFGYYKI